MSVQRGDLVAGRYRVGDPLGPAWHAHDEQDDKAVTLIPAEGDTPDATPWRDRRGILQVTGTATGDAGPWLIAAPVEARTLADAVDQWGALPTEQVLAIAAGAVTPLSGVGPRPATTPDHILLTDEGKVLLLPIPTPEDALFDLGAALFLAAEGRSPFDPPAGEARQPNLAGLIRGLMSKDPDQAAALDRTHAELSRLGAPLDAEHGADTLMAAQVASAEAAEDSAADAAAAAAAATWLGTPAGEEPTHVTQSHEVVTQAMSVDEVLAATDDDLEADSATTAPVEAPKLGTTGEEHTRPVPAVEIDSAITAPVEVPTQPMSAAELLADTTDDLEADSATTAPVEAPTQPDDELTRPVPAIETDSAVTTPVEVPTHPVADADSDGELTRPVPTIMAAGSSPDLERTRPVPTIISGTPAGGEQASASAMPPEPPPTKEEPVAAPTAAITPPVAPAAPPTQAAEVVPPPVNPFGPPPQQPAGPPQQPFGPPTPPSSAPPTQAASAYSPPPSAPNPWIQQPQQAPNPWQNQAAQPPGPWGPNQPPGPPFYPVPGPPPQKNTGKTVGIVIGAVAAVAAVVVVVVLATKGGGKSDKVNNTANSSSHSVSQPSSSAPGTNFPTGSSHSSTSDSPSPSDSSSDSSSPSDSTSSSSDAYTPPPDLTSTPFDPANLNEQSTDKTPMTLAALVPNDYTDEKNVHYTLKAGSIQPCVQTDMSSNMKDILTSNSCKNEIAASYVDDSGQYLVSVKVLPLPDQHTATVVYNDLAQQSAADFGIWCPQDGPGSAACDGDYRSATIKQYREQQHRYIVLSVALAVNHSESSTITPWLDAAAKKAVDVAGPDNWSGNQ